MVILKKSNNSLRTQKSNKLHKVLVQLEEKEDEINRLQTQVADKDHMIKIMQFKLKELVKSNKALNINEKQFLDVQQMISLTGIN